jgi:hypothetical protein
MELYAQPAKWLNDPRLLYHNGVFHLFHLQGPRDYPKPPYEEMAHATSTDLLNWQAGDLLLTPGKSGSWDDHAIWTSGYIFHEGAFYTLYTGLCEAEGGRIQRLGLATSTDLKTWQRHPANPVLEADPRYYEADPDQSPSYNHVAWRDPWLLRHPEDGLFYAFITARLNSGPGEKRGCIALARSEDLVEWECLPPAYAPGTEIYHEVPEVFPWEGRWVLLFGSKDEGLSMKHIVSDDPLDWDSEDLGKVLIGGPGLMEYSATTVLSGNGRDAVHLVYEWLTEDPRHPRVRGRLALPKRLAGGADDLHLRLRDDFVPPPENRLDVQFDSDTAVPAAGTGPRVVTAKLRVIGRGEAGFIIGDHELTVALHPDGTLTADTAGIEAPREWHLSSHGEVALALVDRHVEIYFDRRYLGTLCAINPGDKTLKLYTRGVQAPAFSDVAARALALDN